jgi:hypothetical protein
MLPHTSIRRRSFAAPQVVLTALAALLACGAPAVARPAAQSTQPERAAPVDSAASSPAAARALLELARSAARTPARFALESSATSTLSVANETWRVRGSAQLERDESGALRALALAVELREPGIDAPQRLELALAGGEWLLLDHARRGYARAASLEALPERARKAASILPGGLVSERAYAGLEALGMAEPGEAQAFAGASCLRLASVPRAGLALPEREWLIGASDGWPRLSHERTDLPQAEQRVLRVAVTRIALSDAAVPAPAAVPEDWSELRAEAVAPQPAPEAPQSAIDLGDSLAPLAADFDAAADRPRVLALFSPSCLNCLRMARSLRLGMLEALPHERFSVHIAWVDLLAGDTPFALARALEVVRDPRARHYHDRNRLLGQRLGARVGMPALSELQRLWGHSREQMLQNYLAPALDASAIAYDWVLSYPAGARFERDLLQPQGLATQMDPEAYPGIDAKRFFWGAQMQAEMNRMLRAALAR